MIAQSGDILLGQLNRPKLLTRAGRTFTEWPLEFAREERTASGRLVKDVWATKKAFKITYDIIDGDDLRELLALYILQAELTLVVVEEYDVSTTYTVRLKPFERTRLLSHGQGLWSGVSIEMEQV